MGQQTKHTPFTLSRNAAGQLALVTEDGSTHLGVYPVRAFPISAADDGLSLVSAEGHELLWIACLANLTDDKQQLLMAELSQREFMPEIKRVDAVSSFTTPSIWSVQTSRGAAQFVLRGEEDIRRLSGKTLIVADEHGVQFLIRDLPTLDRHSRKLLDRFL